MFDFWKRFREEVTIIEKMGLLIITIIISIIISVKMADLLSGLQ